jgi:chemotaxis signal transduction protein
VSPGSSGLEGRARSLGREFDGAFALPPSTADSDRVELLVIRVGNDRHAIRIEEIAGLHADRRTTRVPGPLPELLGVTGLRGAIIPVYDLRLLLGYPAGPPPRWMVVARAAAVGLAFDQLEGHCLAGLEAIVTEPPSAPGNGHRHADGKAPARAREVMTGGDGGPDGGRAVVIHLPSVVDDIAARARRVRPAKER